MKLRTFGCCMLVATGLIHSQPARAQADFVTGLRVITVSVGQTNRFYYASANGDVYKREDSSDWLAAPEYLGNFFGGGPVPSNFVTGFRAITSGTGYVAEVFYASSGGDVYVQSGDPSPSHPWQAPSYAGNFFGGSPIPPDFQDGFQIARYGSGGFLLFYYAAANGDIYEQLSTGPWSQPANYKGNFFGASPVKATSSTIGGVKSKYR